MSLCDYGCGREAKFFSLSGRPRCSEKHQSCPFLKHKMKVRCQKCSELISKSNIKRHERTCSGKRKENYEQVNNGYICPHCGKTFSIRGIRYHIWRCHTEEGRCHNPNTGFENETRMGTNGFIKGTQKQISEETKQKLRESMRGRRIHSDDFKKRMSSLAKVRCLGGKNSRKSIKYVCQNGKTISLQSSYEVRVAESLDSCKVRWKRPSYLYWKDKNEEVHRYYPDFYLLDYDVFLDPKNDYLISIDKEKISRVIMQNQVKVLLLDKDHLSWSEIYKLICRLNSIGRMPPL